MQNAVVIYGLRLVPSVTEILFACDSRALKFGLLSVPSVYQPSANSRLGFYWNLDCRIVEGDVGPAETEGSVYLVRSKIEVAGCT